MQSVEKRGQTAHENVARARIFLLGGFRIERGGDMLPDSAWQRRSARSLVKLLAASSSHSRHREQIEEILWPDLNSTSARENLHQALHVARRIFEPNLRSGMRSSFLRLTDVVSLLPEYLWIDADAFERLAREALEGEGLEQYEAALAAYGGELLPEDRYEDWTVQRREELVDLWTQLLSRGATLLEAQGRYEDATAWLRQALHPEPSREEIHRRLMRLALLQGNRHLALKQYEECCTVLREELGTEPEPETQALYRAILGGAGLAQSSLPHGITHLLSGPHIGRREATRIVMVAANRAMAGTGSTVIISGEAGVGKSRLVAEMAREAHGRGALVLYGACYAEEGLLPYGPFAEALDEYVRHSSEAEHSNLASMYPEVARLLSSLTVDTRLSRAVSRTEGARTRLFSAMVRLLTDLSRVRTLVLILEDLHAADKATLQLLHHLARAAPQRRWLVLGTYREADAPIHGETREVVAAITRQRLGQHVELLRLSERESTYLLEALLHPYPPAPPVVGHLYALSRGNPLFLRELVRALREVHGLVLGEGAWDITAQGTAVVPQSIRELVAARATRLGERARKVSSLAAVAGMQSSFELLRDAGGFHQSTLLGALDELLGAQVLDERGGGYAFHHPLFRQALYDQLSPPARASMHLAVARAIERGSPDDVGALAYHFSRTPDTEKALRYLERAGDHAQAVYAQSVAETYYREALRRLVGTANGAQLGRIERKLGRALVFLARFDEALEVLARAIERSRAGGDLEELTRAMALIGRVHRERGTSREAEAELQSLIAEVDGDTGLAVSPEAAAELYLGLAHVYFAEGKYKDCRLVADRGAELAQEAGNEWLLAELVMRRGSGLRMAGRLTEAREAYEEAIRLAESSGNLFALARTLGNMSSIYEDLGEMGRCLALRERSLDVAERLGDPHTIAWSVGSLGSSYVHTGRLEEAKSTSRRALELYQEVGQSWQIPYVFSGLGGIALNQGRLEEAWQYFQQAYEAGEAHADAQLMLLAGRGLVELELAEGRPDAARDRILELTRRVSTYPSAPVLMSYVLAEAQIACGQLDDAAVTLAEAFPKMEAISKMYLVDLLRVRGMLESRQGRPDEACASLTRAAEMARGMPYASGEAQALRELGRLHLDIGDREQAVAVLEPAREIFQRMGAQPYVEQMEALLEQI